MKKIFVSLALILVLLLSVVGCEKKEETPPQGFNFFRYAVDVHGDDFSPKDYAKISSLDDFLEAKGLDESNVEPEREKTDRVILRDISYEGIDGTAAEAYRFYEETLYKASYWIYVEKGKEKAVYEQLCKMAQEHLPAPRQGYTWEDISRRCRAMWDSPDGDLMDLSAQDQGNGTVLITFDVFQNLPKF